MMIPVEPIFLRSRQLPRDLDHYGRNATDKVSKTTFAKTARLRRAKQMLQIGAPSVSAVAFKRDFGNLGHFARDFHEMFGELPSETLSRTWRGA
jgi:AraC family ethanolamine operon transcriptional activator